MAVIFAVSAAFGNIDLSGSFRNDAYALGTTNKTSFNDIAETKLIFSHKTDEWRFYADLRVDLLYGEAANYALVLNLPPEVTNAGLPQAFSTNVLLNYNLNLIRAFLRYTSSIGEWTLGKTYVNFGNYGIFNPFEISKSVNFSDLNYDKDGILAMEYDFSFGDLSGGKAYVSPSGDFTNSAYGGSIYANIAKFDIGAVANRKAANTNLAGVYFKGDLLAGLNASYAYHFDDSGTNRYDEAGAGIDYSFLDGKLFTGLTFYYDGNGAGRTNDYNFLITADRYFVAKYYLYANAIYAYDEFLNFQLNTFVNCIDWSMLFIPLVQYTISDGLDLTGEFVIPAGSANQEFSKDRLLEYVALFRVEAKF